MAEALGVVASGISIGSLAIQLLDSVQRIRRFWKSVDEAPKDIGDLIEELHVLGSVFSDLTSQPGSVQALPPSSFQMCLQHCSRVLEELKPIVLELQSDLLGSKRRKQWAAIKTAFKKGDLHDLTRRLERSKSTLCLALDVYKL